MAIGKLPDPPQTEYQKRVIMNTSSNPVPTEDSGKHSNPEAYRGDRHWQFSELSCCLSGCCLSAVPAGISRRIRELTIRNAALGNIVLFLEISAGPVKLSVDIPAQTTRQWSSQDGRVFTAAQVPCFRVTPSCTYPGCAFITGAGLDECDLQPC